MAVQSLRRHSTPLQKIADCIVAHPLQVLSQVAARIIDWGIQQVLDILALGDHALYTTAPAPSCLTLTRLEPFKRKSCIIYSKTQQTDISPDEIRQVLQEILPPDAQKDD